MKTVLLVEDEPDLCSLYQDLLEEGGYKVLRALDGMSGLKLARDSSPDLILLDIMLPKMHGIDVLKHLRNDERTKDLPVILLTNLSQRSVFEEAQTLGIVGYIIKFDLNPLDLGEHLDTFFQSGEFQNVGSVSRS